MIRLDNLHVFIFQCVYDIGLQRYKDYKIRVCEKYSILFGCLVAKTDIGAGEIIFKELSLVCSPSPSSPPTCLTCSSPVTGSYLCPSCGWPMCNKKCALNPVHANQVISSNFSFAKCGVFDSQQNPLNFSLKNYRFESVFPLLTEGQY